MKFSKTILNVLLCFVLFFAFICTCNRGESKSAREEIVDFSKDSVNVLNEEIRKIRADMNNMGFQDAGDTAAVAYALGSLTTDGAWHELSLKDTIGVDAKVVYLKITLQDDAADSTILFRKDGNANEVNISEVKTQVVNQSVSYDIAVPVGNDGKIEYKGSNLVFNTIDIVIKGWTR